MVALALVVTLTAATSYPGTLASTASSSGRYTVENVDLDEPTAAGNHHALFLVDHTAPSRGLLMEYGRNVEVSWAPDRDAVAVTEHAGSSDAEVLVFMIENGRVTRRVALLSLVTAARPELGREVRRHGHRYLDLVRWNDAGRLECRLRANDGGTPIDARLDIGLDGTVSSIPGR
jgi:hypothetical protein